MNGTKPAQSAAATAQIPPGEEQVAPLMEKPLPAVETPLGKRMLQLAIIAANGDKTLPDDGKAAQYGLPETVSALKGAVAANELAAGIFKSRIDEAIGTVAAAEEQKQLNAAGRALLSAIGVAVEPAAGDADATVPAGQPAPQSAPQSQPNAGGAAAQQSQPAAAQAQPADPAAEKQKQLVVDAMKLRLLRHTLGIINRVRDISKPLPEPESQADLLKAAEDYPAAFNARLETFRALGKSPDGKIDSKLSVSKMALTIQIGRAASPDIINHIILRPEEREPAKRAETFEIAQKAKAELLFELQPLKDDLSGKPQPGVKPPAEEQAKAAAPKQAVPASTMPAPKPAPESPKPQGEVRRVVKPEVVARPTDEAPTPVVADARPPWENDTDQAPTPIRAAADYTAPKKPAEKPHSFLGGLFGGFGKQKGPDLSKLPKPREPTESLHKMGYEKLASLFQDDAVEKIRTKVSAGLPEVSRNEHNIQMMAAVEMLDIIKKTHPKNKFVRDSGHNHEK